MTVLQSSVDWMLGFFRPRVGVAPYVYGGVWSPTDVTQGCDCCLVGETMVWGPDGPRQIRDLRSGHRVFSYQDNKMVVSEVVRSWQAERQETFKVRTRRRSVVASANHPFLRLARTPNRGSIAGEAYTEWVRLDELRRGDLLVQPSECRTDAKCDKLPSGRTVNLNEAWVLGLFVGDGSISGNTLRICVYGELRTRATEVLLETLGKTRLGHPYTVGWRDSDGLHIKCTKFCQELENAGFRWLAHEKRIPECVWGWSSELQRAFLAGYCDADGHRPANTSRHGVRTYSSCSRGLLDDVRIMHIMLGDPVTNVTVNRRRKAIRIKGRDVKNARPLYSFAVSAKHEVAGGIASNLDSTAVRKWLDCSEFSLARVIDVSPQGMQDTYDVEIQGSHNFIADGVVVHNSGAVGTVLEAIVNGPNNMNWGHVVTTESWPYNYSNNTPVPIGTVGPYGSIAVASPADIPADAALTIDILHGGGGANSHMNCVLTGTIIESNGTYGTCTQGTGGATPTNPEWTDWWYLPGPITEDVAINYLDPAVLDVLFAQFYGALT